MVDILKLEMKGEARIVHAIIDIVRRNFPGVEVSSTNDLDPTQVYAFLRIPLEAK